MIHLILVLAFLGFLSWLVLQIPMPDVVRKIIVGVLIFAFVIYALNSLGVHTGFHLR